jgi:dihydroorotase/N-acyl-D-amino-acid deacylase
MYRSRRLWLFASTSLLALLPAAGADPTPVSAPACDLLLTGGRVVDGTGAPWTRTDVCVTGDTIAAMGDLAGRAAKRTIDVSKLVVSPGFVDLLGQSEYNVLVDPRAVSKITQGITTELTGEGESIAPLDDKAIADAEDLWKHYGVRPDWHDLAGYERAFVRARPTINLGTLVGAGGLRSMVVGKSDRAATPAELARMQELVAEAMRQGAFGLSTALQYVPGRFASTEEIVVLARVAARYGGRYFTHQRSEQKEIDGSIDEVVRISREAGIPARIWHFKTACESNFGRMPAMLAKLETARAAGVDVQANQYPWSAAMNGLAANLPPFALEGGTEAMLARLRDPAMRPKIKAAMRVDDGAWENQFLCSGGGKGILVASVLDAKLKRYEGKTVAAIAREEGKDEEDALMDLVLADRGNTGNILFIMDEHDVEAALADRLVAFDTDSPAQAADGPFAGEGAHPRGWGSTARILGHYVREAHVLTLEEAVRKMTSLSAAEAGILDRGILRPGMKADLVAFDPDTVATEATFTEPHRTATGIPYVIVNGEVVVDGGVLGAARPGRFLHGPGYGRDLP